MSAEESTCPPPRDEEPMSCGDGGDDEEVFATGDGGSAEDQAFDELIGVVEDFMFSFDVMALFSTLPPLQQVDDDHQRHKLHKGFVAKIEAQLDAHVTRRIPGVEFRAAAKLIESRHKEVSEEVWDFVNHGCMDYVSFLALWKEQRP
jgi:ADP-ribosylation factor 2-binding protein